MDREHAVMLWNAAIYHSNNYDANGNESGNYTPFGGAALACNIAFLNNLNSDSAIADRQVAAELLREMATALEGI